MPGSPMRHPAVTMAAALTTAAVASVAIPAVRSGARRLPDRLGAVADRRRLAVLPLRGVIGGQLRAGEVSRQLDRLRDDRRIRGVLLDIDSPGGSAVESELLHAAVRRLAAAKPVVAWVRGTGASGSYFLACGATRVLAFPGAIVGSIGVISARPVVADLLGRIGASIAVTKTGEYKDHGAPWREPTDADREKERALVDAVFRRFTGAVQDARHLTDAQLAAVTTGEVWLATEAVELGLIDAVADEDEALDELQRLAGMPRRALVRIERRRTLARRLGLPGAALLDTDLPTLLAEIEGRLRVPTPLA